MLLMGKSTISTGPFSIAMLVHQRVIGCKTCRTAHAFIISQCQSLQARNAMPCHAGSTRSETAHHAGRPVSATTDLHVPDPSDLAPTPDNSGHILNMFEL